MGVTDHWNSPREVADPLEEFAGGPVGIDPCSNETSIIKAVVRYVNVGGLILPWKPAPGHPQSAYENPPYSQLDAWTDKGIVEIADRRLGGRVDLIRLVPVASSTAWWRRAFGLEPVRLPGGVEVLPRKPTVIFTKRLQFLDGTGKQVGGARFDSVLFYYGRRERAFLRAFRAITSWTP